MNKIKSIIFDLGGVFIDIDYAATKKEFINLGIKNFDELYKQDFVSSLFEDLEVGKINENNFYNQFRIISNSTLSNEQIKKAWNAMIGEFWYDRLEFAFSLKQQYNVFLLSNTNKIHFDYFETKFKQAYPKKSIEDFFHQIYYSHQIGLRKPNASCYLKILEEHQLLPNEVLFIDDTITNIEGAKNVDLQIVHLMQQMNLKNSVNQILSIYQ